jgi:hypothetical protein
MYLAELQGLPERSQVFRISDDNGIGISSAFNLLNGRSIRKAIRQDRNERQSVHAWFQLDFNLKDVHGNFKLEQLKIPDREYSLAAELKKYPIKKMKTDDKVRLILSLAWGNMEHVTMVRNGKDESLFVEACPRERDLSFYNNERVKLERKDLIENEARHVIKSKHQTKRRL